jgi:formamidopyrimidine-DNA glycosylase
MKEFGVGLVYSEMISAKGLLYENDKTWELTQVEKNEHPISIQIFGGDVDSIVKAAVMIDTETGAVLYSKNPDEALYPASLTKIATAIYAIEKGNLNDIVTVSRNAATTEGTRVYLNIGEKVQLKKLIQGMLINSGNDAAVAIAEHLGGTVEQFEKDLNEEYLMRIISRRPKIKIKQIIMDQSVIAGVGNIYADESLFCSKISPLRLAKDVKRSELTKLIECIRKVLKMGLEYGGSSENTYVNIEGKKGQMQNHFQIYRKTGQKCPNNCGTVKRTVIGGRGTHFCPACQK